MRIRSWQQPALGRDTVAFVDSLFDAPIGIAFFDRRLRYLRINCALAAINGLPPEAHIGRTVGEVLPEMDRQVVDSLRRVLATGVPIVNQETSGETPAAPGVRRWWLASYFPARRGGEVIGLNSVVVDITDRKHAEEELQSARLEAEAANRSKDDFLATLSHELRTPLNAMLGWAQLARGGRLDDKAQARALETIERNARAQAQLIEDILDVSRIIAGKLRLHPQRVEVAAVVEAALEAVRPAAASKPIDLVLELAPALEPVRADPARLQQVVWNLLSNAIKFTPAGGRVVVRVGSAGDELTIEVRDDGKGIAREFLPLVFDRFRQADGAITRAHGGLGLGLAIVRHLIQAHGGSVRADSDGEGRGATFTVRLPRAACPLDRDDFADGPPTVVETRPALDRLRILVVDDEPDARELMTLLLQQQGAEVLAVGDAPSALAAFLEWRPNLLLSDIGLPGEDGYALIKKLRALPGGSVPAVALTAYAGEDHYRLALRAGFQMHVPKPVDPDALLTVIARVTGWARTG